VRLKAHLHLNLMALSKDPPLPFIIHLCVFAALC
jgi:hypothetical protein